MSRIIENDLVEFRVETHGGEEVLMFGYDAPVRDRELARLIYEVDKLKKDALDAARYRAWREVVVTTNGEFLNKFGAALEEIVGDNDPSAEDWDKAMDAVIAAEKKEK